MLFNLMISGESKAEGLPVKSSSSCTILCNIIGFISMVLALDFVASQLFQWLPT